MGLAPYIPKTAFPSRKRSSDVLFLMGEITWDSVKELWNQIIQARITRDLILVISSPGGDSDAAWGLYTLLSSVPFNIITVGAGRVCSSATLLYMTGSSRYAYPFTTFLFHSAVHENSGEVPTHVLEEEVAGEKIDNNNFGEILKAKTSLPKNLLDVIVQARTSIYLNANQAASYGLVTKVIEKITDIT